MTPGSEPTTGQAPVGALSGYTIGVTADRRRDEQAELLERRGATVVFGPVIRTLPLTDEVGLRCATDALIAHPPDVVVLSTALGTRGWFAAAESLDLGDDLLDALTPARVLARGPKAVGAAMTAGLDVAWKTPESTNAELVALLADEASHHPAGTPLPRVAVQLDGAEGSPLADQIASLGYDTVAVPVYRWTLPEDPVPALRVIAAVGDRTLDAVTFTSAHAVTNFMALATDAGLHDAVIDACRDGVTVLAVGPVSAARAESVGLTDPLQPVHPRLGAMVQALVADFTQRALSLDIDGIPIVVQGRLVNIGSEEPVLLTDRERAVLHVLLERPGAVVSKQALLQRVWSGESDDHVVEVTVGRLRRRLGNGGVGIETVMRRGYRIARTS